MANGMILELCNCSAYQDIEEQLESRRRAEEQAHADNHPEAKDPKDG